MGPGNCLVTISPCGREPGRSGSGATAAQGLVEVDRVGGARVDDAHLGVAARARHRGAARRGRGPSGTPRPPARRAPRAAPARPRRPRHASAPPHPRSRRRRAEARRARGRAAWGSAPASSRDGRRPPRATAPARWSHDAASAATRSRAERRLSMPCMREPSTKLVAARAEHEPGSEHGAGRHHHPDLKGAGHESGHDEQAREAAGAPHPQARQRFRRGRGTGFDDVRSASGLAKPPPRAAAPDARDARAARPRGRSPRRARPPAPRRSRP